MLDTAALGQDAQIADAARESNHRIANNLALVSSLVRMKSNAITKHGRMFTSDEVAELLQEVAVRIDGVAKLHRLLSAQDSTLPVMAGPFLTEVCAGVARALASQDNVVFKDESEETALPPERLNALGLFLAEGLTNAIKHAHPTGVPGKVYVRFSGREGALNLIIQDDGIGMPEGFDTGKGGGLGMRIMRSLGDQLGGAMSVRTTDLGVQVGLRLNGGREKLAAVAGL